MPPHHSVCSLYPGIVASDSRTNVITQPCLCNTHYLWLFNVTKGMQFVKLGTSKFTRVSSESLLCLSFCISYLRVSTVSARDIISWRCWGTWRIHRRLFTWCQDCVTVLMDTSSSQKRASWPSVSSVASTIVSQHMGQVSILNLRSLVTCNKVCKNKLTPTSLGQHIVSVKTALTVHAHKTGLGRALSMYILPAYCCNRDDIDSMMRDVFLETPPGDICSGPSLCQEYM